MAAQGPADRRLLSFKGLQRNAREGSWLASLLCLFIAFGVRVMAALVDFTEYLADRLRGTQRANLAPAKSEIVGALEVLEDLIESRQRKVNSLRSGQQTNECSDPSGNVSNRLRTINEQRSAIAVLQKTWLLLVQLRDTSAHL